MPSTISIIVDCINVINDFFACKSAPLGRFWASAKLDLAEAASVGIATIRTNRRLSAGQLGAAVETVWKIQLALEAAGVEFIPEDDAKGPGVRLKHRLHAKEPEGAASWRKTARRP